MIEIRAAHKSFGGRRLWTDVDLTVADGSLVALVGPSGSGKSTLLNCLGLLDTVDGGQVLVDGEDVTHPSPRRARRFRRDRLGYLFQNYALIENATIKQNLAVVLGSGARLAGARREAQEEALARVGMGGRSGDLVHTLSGGEQQRVALARLLVKAPDVVLADEPTGALDADNAALVIEVLREIARGGATVVVATHSDDVRRACDEVVDVSRFAPAPRSAASDAVGLDRAVALPG